MEKYQRHTPFYCQEESYNWQGIKLSRQNMCNWQQKVYKKLLPLENQFKKELKKGKYLQMDETPLEVMKINEDEIRAEYWDEERYRKKDDKKEKPDSQKKCYMWVVRGGEEKHPVHLYNFKWTRSGKNVLEFLEDFKGSVLQTDGYAGYDTAIDFWNKIIQNTKLFIQTAMFMLGAILQTQLKRLVQKLQRKPLGFTKKFSAQKINFAICLRKTKFQKQIF